MLAISGQLGGALACGGSGSRCEAWSVCSAIHVRSASSGCPARSWISPSQVRRSARCPSGACAIKACTRSTAAAGSRCSRASTRRLSPLTRPGSRVVMRSAMASPCSCSPAMSCRRMRASSAGRWPGIAAIQRSTTATAPALPTSSTASRASHRSCSWSLLSSASSRRARASSSRPRRCQDISSSCSTWRSPCSDCSSGSRCSSACSGWPLRSASSPARRRIGGTSSSGCCSACCIASAAASTLPWRNASCTTMPCSEDIFGFNASTRRNACSANASMSLPR
ncbi:hypothetical protein D3C73_1022720 [compost metagenome]